jgi:malate synthase
LNELGFEGPARDLFERVALADDFATFLTLPAYELID